MSTRRWETNDGWEVLTGYVPDLGHYFLVIRRVCRTCGGEEAVGAERCRACRGGYEYVFNNLDDRPAPYGAMRDLDDVMQTLGEHGIPHTDDLEGLLIVDELTAAEDETDFGVLERGQAA